MTSTITQATYNWDRSPLFRDIEAENLPVMLGCLGYQVETYKKGEFISMEGERLQNIGIVLHGCVDMIKEDFWGNKTIVMRMREQTVETYFDCRRR